MRELRTTRGGSAGPALSMRRNLLRLPGVAIAEWWHDRGTGEREREKEEERERERALVQERVIYALIMQQPRFITSDTRCPADSEIDLRRTISMSKGVKVNARVKGRALSHRDGILLGIEIPPDDFCSSDTSPMRVQFYGCPFFFDVERCICASNIHQMDISFPFFRS